MNTCITDFLWCFSNQLKGLIFFSSFVKLNTAALACNLKSGNGFQKLFLSISGNSGNSQDLTAINVKAYIIQYLNVLPVIDGQMGNRKSFHRIYRCGTGNIQFHLLAYHHLCERIFSGLAGIYGTYVLSFSQNGNAVGNLQNLVKLMGNNDN